MFVCVCINATLWCEYRKCTEPQNRLLIRQHTKKPALVQCINIWHDLTYMASTIFIIKNTLIHKCTLRICFDGGKCKRDKKQINTWNRITIIPSSSSRFSQTNRSAKECIIEDDRRARSHWLFFRGRQLTSPFGWSRHKRAYLAQWVGCKRVRSV